MWNNGWCWKLSQCVVKGQSDWYQDYVSCSTPKFTLAQLGSNIAVWHCFSFSIFLCVFLLSFLSLLCASFFFPLRPFASSLLFFCVPIDCAIIIGLIFRTLKKLPTFEFVLWYDGMRSSIDFHRIKTGKNYLKFFLFSRNDPKSIQQTEKHFFKKIY